MNKKLQTAPVFIKQIRKMTDVDDTVKELYNGINLVNIINVYEIWKVFLEYNQNETNTYFIIIGADNVVEGYKNGEWTNIKYLGFYSTEMEAENYINGYLK